MFDTGKFGRFALCCATSNMQPMHEQAQNYVRRLRARDASGTIARLSGIRAPNEKFESGLKFGANEELSGNELLLAAESVETATVLSKVAGKDMLDISKENGRGAAFAINDESDDCCVAGVADW